MTDLVIACLSQKGGVGKSTIARLIATSYAQHGQRVGLFDFNLSQKTSIIWNGIREDAGVKPEIMTVAAQKATVLRTDRRVDVAVADGRPDSPEITMSIAREADLVVIPTTFTIDDLVPQRRFALELMGKGVAHEKILFVINRVLESDQLLKEARVFLDDFQVAQTTLPYRTSYMRAHMGGYSVGEVRRAVMGNMKSLADAAQSLATEIALQANKVTA